MPNLFGRAGPFDESVNKICDIGTGNDDWQLIMNLCDKVNTTPQGPKLIIKAILKKMKLSDEMKLGHVVTLLDACVNNCARPLHLELCTRENLNELGTFLVKNNSSLNQEVANLKAAMVKWSKAFGEDPQLYLLSVTIINLKGQGVGFPTDIGNAPPVNLPTPVSSASRTEQEDDEMMKKAIELSLKDSQGKGGGSSQQHLYPTFTADKPAASDHELFKVKALYDFEAAEENEITFKTGDIISVTDNNDQNWWKGRTARSSGLFPSNFVTQQMDTPAPVEQPVAKEPVKITQVNPQQIDLLLEMLRNADATVTNEEEDAYIAELESQVEQQEPLVNAEFTTLKAKHDNLSSINDDMSRVVGIFHKLLKEAPVVAPVQVPQPIQYQSYQPPQNSVGPSTHQYEQAGPMRGYAPPQPNMGNHPTLQPGQSYPQGSQYPPPTPPPSYATVPRQGESQYTENTYYNPPPQQQVQHQGPGGFQPIYPGHPQATQHQPPMYNNHPPPGGAQYNPQSNIAHVSPIAQSEPNGLQ